MQKFIDAVDKISKWSGMITAFLILPMILIIVYTALMRYVFHYAVNWGFELSLFVYGLHFMLGGAYCLNLKSHVIVDIVPSRLPFIPRKVLESLASLVVFTVCIILVWLGAKWAWKSTLIWERSIHQTAFNPPVWWYKWIIPISALLLGLQALADFLVRIRDMVTQNKES